MVQVPNLVIRVFGPSSQLLPKTSFGYSIPTKTGVFLNTSKLGAMVNSGTLPSAISARRSSKDASVSLTGVDHCDSVRPSKLPVHPPPVA
jgi:hypothetical protein